MDYVEDVGEFKKLELTRQPKTAETATPEQKYWRRFKTVTITKAYAAVYSVSFSPSAPYDFATTNSTRVQIYSCKGKAAKKTISRFKDVVYCSSFRPDGKLLVAGGEERDLKVFDTGSGAQLRVMKGHEEAIHACQFSSDRLHVASGGDDSVIKYWDISSGECLTTMSGHGDNVRCLAASPASSDVWASGSYDHTVKLWDCRLGESVLSVNHGQPVQALLMLPGGGMMITAGGNYMKVWDVLSGGRLLQTVCNHNKPITCLAMDAEGGRVLSGSMDHHLKVYDVQEYKVRYSLNYTQPILSMGISPDRNTIVVGMASGLLNVRGKTNKEALPAHQMAQRRPRAGTFHYFIRGQRDAAGEDDYKVERIRKLRLAPYEKSLKTFNYTGALDAVLELKDPRVICSLLHELFLRDAAKIALSGRNEVHESPNSVLFSPILITVLLWQETVVPVLEFLCKYITNQDYSALLTDTADLVLELYTTIIGRSEKVDELLFKLRWRVHEQLALDAELLRLQGSLELILTSAMHARGGAAN